MADSTLNVLINVTQRGASTIRGITSDLGQLGRTSLSVAGGGLLALGGGLAFVGTQMVTLGSDAEEMQGKFNTVFREFAGPVTTELTNFAENVGRSRFELMGFASTIQDTLVPLGFARGAAADMSTEVVKLATDLGSFNNIPTEQVIMDIQSALVGNTETLRKYGVVASQAAIDQFALTNGLWDGEEAMDAQTKAATIMQLIMASTTDAQGDAARTSESWANQMRALKAQITDTATEIGLQLLPAVTPLLAMLGEMAAERLPALVASLQPFIEAITEISGLLAAGDIEGALTRAFGSEMAQRIIDLATRFGAFITDVVIPFVDDHGPAIQSAFLAIAATLIAAGIGSLLMSLFNPLTLLLVAVGLLAAAWTENWGDIQGKTKGFVEWFAFTGWPNIEKALDSIMATVRVAGEVWDNIWFHAGVGFGIFTGLVRLQWNTTIANLEATGQRFLAFGNWLNQNVWLPMLNAILAVLNAINLIAGAVGTALNALNQLPNQLPGLPGPGPGTLPGAGKGDDKRPAGDGVTINNNYTMNVNGGDTGSVQNEFGAMAAAAGAI